MRLRDYLQDKWDKEKELVSPRFIAHFAREQIKKFGNSLTKKS